MKNIIGVRFKKVGKIYFFNPNDVEVNRGDKVLVDTVQGEEIGTVAIPNKEVEEEKIVAPLKKIIRVATKKDLDRCEECRKIEKEAMKVCEKKIKEHKLDMNLIDVECKFDNSKLLFYFVADERIDFRELVKELAAIYKTRIELRQIGVRDRIKRLGGNGVCRKRTLLL